MPPPPPGIRVKRGASRASRDSTLQSFKFISIGAFEGTSDEAYTQYQLYNTIWDTVRRKFDQVQHNEVLLVVDQVCEFLRTFIHSKSGMHRSIIPVASVSTGLVRGENSRLFNLIRLKLQCTMKPFLARIDTSTKPTIKMVLQSIMEQLNKQNFRSGGNFDTDSPASSPQEITNLLDRCKIHPLILLVEDAEQLDPNVLQDLLCLICSGRYKDYSVQLILGSPHGLHSWQDIVPQEIESSFLQKEFRACKPEKRIADFWTIILSPAIPLRISGPVVKYFQEYYMENHSSVSRLLQFYHLCLMKHFTKHRNTLCIGPSLQQKMSSDPNLVALGYQLDSCQEGGSKSKDVELAEYHNQALLWIAIVHFLFEVNKDLSLAPLGRTLADVYVLAWDKNMFTYDPRQTGSDETPFQKFVTQISYLSYPDIKLRLQNGLEILHKFNSNDETDSMISSLCHELRSLIAFKAPKKSPERKPRTPARAGLRAVSSADWQKQREEHSQKTAALANSFVTKVKEFLHRLKKLLTPLHKNPVSEAFIFDDIDWLKEIVTPQAQKTLHLDLLTRHELPGHDESFQLDSSCLYKLVSEQGVLNMGVDDLFQAFSADQEGTANLDEDETDQEHMLFRLRQAAIELEVLGIFKSNKRNSDFLTRQMWQFDPWRTEDWQ